MRKTFPHAKEAFTLIEVMVSVMIISVVIMALIEMFSNNTHLFSYIKKQTTITQYTSFFISNKEYGFQNKDVTLNDLLRDFNLEDDLRRELKNSKAKVLYQKLERIDLSEQSGDTEAEGNSKIVLEIGKTILQAEGSSSSLLRLRVE